MPLSLQVAYVLIEDIRLIRLTDTPYFFASSVESLKPTLCSYSLKSSRITYTFKLSLSCVKSLTSRTTSPRSTRRSVIMKRTTSFHFWLNLGGEPKSTALYDVVEKCMEAHEKRCLSCRRTKECVAATTIS